MNIHYIVAFYLGDRMTKTVNDLLVEDRLFLVKKHIEALNKLVLPNITKATFVVSEYSEETNKSVINLVENTEFKIPVELVLRKNQGYSYAAWNTVINKSIEKNENFDYYFLFEDDYAPNVDNFYDEFANLCVGNIAYVCQEYKENHASASIGILSGRIARQIKKEFGSVFKILSHNDTYGGAIQNQVHFLDFFKVKRYEFTDVCKKCLQIFTERNGFKVYGNLNGRITISPIAKDDWRKYERDAKYGKFRCIEEIFSFDNSNYILDKIWKMKNFFFDVKQTIEEAIEEFKTYEDAYVLFENNRPICLAVVDEHKIIPYMTKNWDHTNNLSNLYRFSWWITREKEIPEITFQLKNIGKDGSKYYKTIGLNIE